jgi:dephospho-CoA kinase
MTKIIGLTGGIGSGKTTVADEFAKLGVPVYISDFQAKQIMQQPTTILLLRQKFGEHIFRKEVLDRNELAEMVFSDSYKLNELNQLIHPLVKNDFENWLKKHNDKKFVIKEAAILFESGSYLDCDKIILVVAPIEIRMQRVLKRDGISRELILKKIASQISDEIKMQKSDYIIENLKLENTVTQVRKIFNLLNDL